MKRPTKKEVFTIPNIISYFRILLIPVFCYMFLKSETSGDCFFAGLVVLLSSFTDLFDGMIARKFNQVTDLGKILDPVADKLTHAALAICLAVKYPLMWALIALMALKEGYMAYMGIKMLKKGKMLDGAMWYGKICTAVLFVGMMVLFMLPTIDKGLAEAIIVMMMAVMLATLGMYIPTYKKMENE